MTLADLPQGALFRFPDDPPEVRRKVLGGAGAPLVVVESGGFMGPSQATFMGTLPVEPLHPAS